MPGFATTRREDILVRAGQTFTLDMQMGLSTLQETITVSGESPMIETAKATTSITLDRELIRAAPISSRRVFSDALDLAPGISSRNVDDGVGRRSYYFKGAVIFSHVFTLEGAPAGSFLDSSAHSIGFGGDTVQDSELKLAGVDRGLTHRHGRRDEHHRATRRQPVPGLVHLRLPEHRLELPTTPRAAAPRAACRRRSR